MARDRRLGSYFWLHEFPCYWKATEEQADVLELQARTLLDPLRRRFGRITPTSWLYWSDCRPRTGAHSDPGTVDFVATGLIEDRGGAPRKAWADQTPAEREITKQSHYDVVWWAGQYLPASQFGQIIDERSHVHLTRPGVGGRTGQNPVGEVLREPEEGRFVYLFEGSGGTGTGNTPVFTIPGIDVVVAGPGTRALSWLLGLGVLGAVLRPKRT